MLTSNKNSRKKSNNFTRIWVPTCLLASNSEATTSVGKTEKNNNRNALRNRTLAGHSSNFGSETSLKYKLSEPQTKVLACGLGFAVSPKNIDDYVVACEKACWKLPKIEADQLRAEIFESLKSSKLPKSTISHNEPKAIKLLQNEKIHNDPWSWQGQCQGDFGLIGIPWNDDSFTSSWIKITGTAKH